MNVHHHRPPHHLSIAPEHVAGNDGRGRVFLLPGSDGRACRIGEHLADHRVIPSPRQLNVHLGRMELEDGRGADVGVVATGMGCPSLDIVATELIHLGARVLVRVGTSGSLQPEQVRAGDLVIATAAVRDEGTSDSYADRGFPAVADTEVVRALERAARAAGHGARTYRGLLHTKDSLFAREMGQGPRAEANRRFIAEMEALGVLASEMEAAHLFVLGHVHSRRVAPLDSEPTADRVRTGALVAVIGDDTAFAEPERVAAAEEAAIEVALRAAVELVAPATSPPGD